MDGILGIPTEVITGGGFTTLALGFFWLMFTGRVVPRSIHEETRVDRDEWRKAHDELKTTLQTLTATQAVQAEAITKFTASAQTTEQVMTAIREAVTRLETGGR